MFQYAHNFKIYGSAFTNEQNGMTGALNEFVVKPILFLQPFMQRSPDIASMGVGRCRP